MQVICAQCQTPYELGPEYAGKKVRCRTCQAVIEVPVFGPPADAGAPGWQAGPEIQPHAYGQQGAAAGGPSAYGADPAAAFETHRKPVGIFNIIVGVLSLLWAAFAGFIVVVGAMVAQDMPRRHRDEEYWIDVVVFYGVMFLLSAVTGIIQLAAGTKVLKGSSGARGLGLVSGFVSCASLWGCCVYPFCLGSGIYTLIILFGQNAKDYLEVRRHRF